MRFAYIFWACVIQSSFFLIVKEKEKQQSSHLAVAACQLLAHMLSPSLDLSLAYKSTALELSEIGKVDDVKFSPQIGNNIFNILPD